MVTLNHLLLRKHPMHVVADTGSAKLWLGGTAACLDANMLLENHIQCIWPAARCATSVEDTAAVKVLPMLDGTAVVHGSPPFEQVVEAVDKVASLLASGQSVLVACHNGAHRSATDTALLIMRLSGKSGPEVHQYLGRLRNIVDLASKAPPNKYRMCSVKPIDFLSKIHTLSTVGDMVGQNQEILASSRFANAAWI